MEKPAVETKNSVTDYTKYNLRRYNKRRHELLLRIPEPPKAFDENEVAL